MTTRPSISPPLRVTSIRPARRSGSAAHEYAASTRPGRSSAERIRTSSSGGWPRYAATIASLPEKGPTDGPLELEAGVLGETLTRPSLPPAGAGVTGCRNDAKVVGLPLYDAPLSQVAEPLHRALGLTDGELDRIRELLERDPNHFELAVFSLLWSEHCAYKHSALLLGRFPTDGPRVLQGPGENAGVLDLGEGEAVAFKVESHNHPSAVEPFQGAATGVGGILRDIVAMGARPVALLDGLRFGEAGFAFDRAVAGIGGYGN